MKLDLNLCRNASTALKLKVTASDTKLFVFSSFSREPSGAQLSHFFKASPNKRQHYNICKQILRFFKNLFAILNAIIVA